jgi:hypothetical protein
MEYFYKGLEFGFRYILVIFFLFQVKHMVVDFFVQNRFPYMWLNKGKFFHPGGWLHAISHGVCSYWVFYLVYPPVAWEELAVGLCIWETFIHFGIDFVKMNIGRKTGWKCNTSPYFWDLLGVDQFLHQLTYLAMIAVWCNNLL